MIVLDARKDVYIVAENEAIMFGIAMNAGKWHISMTNLFIQRTEKIIAIVAMKGADMQTVFEKIIEKLEELADELYKAYCIGFNSDDRAEYDAYTNAIEIVKGGGVDVNWWSNRERK